jgi:hypothetical protein
VDSGQCCARLFAAILGDSDKTSFFSSSKPGHGGWRGAGAAFDCSDVLGGW